MTPQQAGWTDTLAPAECPGSGQVAIFAESGARLACPACGRPTRAWRVMLTYGPEGRTDAVLIATHLPATGSAPTLSLNL